MPSRKQAIYCKLLRNGILHLRMLCAGGAWGTDEQVLAMREEFCFGHELANFLHRVHGSILEPEYVDNDITFINWAFPVHIQRLGDRLDCETAALMLEFYEGVPDSLRSLVTWRPSAEFRQLAGSRRRAEQGSGDG
jgi:hypothetical protein